MSKQPTPDDTVTLYLTRRQAEWLVRDIELGEAMYAYPSGELHQAHRILRKLRKAGVSDDGGEA